MRRLTRSSGIVKVPNRFQIDETVCNRKCASATAMGRKSAVVKEVIGYRQGAPRFTRLLITRGSPPLGPPIFKKKSLRTAAALALQLTGGSGRLCRGHCRLTPLEQIGLLFEI